MSTGRSKQAGNIAAGRVTGSNSMLEPAYAKADRGYEGREVEETPLKRPPFIEVKDRAYHLAERVSVMHSNIASSSEMILGDIGRSDVVENKRSENPGQRSEALEALDRLEDGVSELEAVVNYFLQGLL